MQMVKFERPGIKAHWHIDVGGGITLCQTVGAGKVVQADIKQPLTVRICMKCWKKHQKINDQGKELRELIGG